MNIKTAFYLISTFPTFLLAISCSSVPVQLDLMPKVYEDSDVRVEYAIGSKVYSISIYNKTPFDMLLDYSKASIVSFTGQSRNLNALPEDTHIPPRSFVIVHSNQSAIFNTDIYSIFEMPNYSGGSIYSEKKYLEQFYGESIKLILPILVQGTERIITIDLWINGVITPHNLIDFGKKK